MRWPCNRGDGYECVGHDACVSVGRRARASIGAPDPQRRRLGSDEDLLPEGHHLPCGTGAPHLRTNAVLADLWR